MVRQMEHLHFHSTGEDVDKNRFGADLKLDMDLILLQAEGILGKNDETDALGFYTPGAFKVVPKVQGWRNT